MGVWKNEFTTLDGFQTKSSCEQLRHIGTRIAQVVSSHSHGERPVFEATGRRDGDS